MDRDPWTLDDGHPLDIRRPAVGSRREAYGRVYEVITSDPRDGEHPYVGMTRKTIHQRVHGARGHTSRAAIEADPWKARILDGRAGYRQLEVVYATGDATADEASLRRAEAAWIDRLRPTHNRVRPVRPPVHQWLAPPRSANVTTRRRTAAQYRARRVRTRVAIWLLLVAFFVFLAARLIVAMQLPWPPAPWIAAPIIGVALGWATFEWLDKRYRRLTGRRR